MIKPELYNRTTDILYQAYFNDTLQRGNCAACAVGNIVTVNCGYVYGRNAANRLRWMNVQNGTTDGWMSVFVTFNNNYQELYPEKYTGLAKKQIDSTGYSWVELAQIEKAFETSPLGYSVEDAMFNGLCAVLDCLAQIHQVTDQDLLTSNNKRFKEQYEKRIAV